MLDDTAVPEVRADELLVPTPGPTADAERRVSLPDGFDASLEAWLLALSREHFGVIAITPERARATPPTDGPRGP